MARADLCMFGLRSRDQEGEAPATKPTRFMGNSLEVYKILNQNCDGSCPRHVHLIEGRAKVAAIYPWKLCKSVIQGTVRQMRVDRRNFASLRCTGDRAEDHFCRV